MRTWDNRILGVAILAIALLPVSDVRSAVVISQGSGEWGNSATWGGVVPGAADDVFIAAGHTVTNTGLDVRTINSLSVSGILTHATNGSIEAHKLILEINNNLTIAAGGAIDVSGKGYAAGQGDGKNSGRGGAGHGGEGGRGYQASLRGPSYGSVTNPVRCGSGSTTGKGGGAVIVTVVGTIALDGAILADAVNGAVYSGGAAGGSVNLTAASLSGGGTISTQGTDGNNANAGGGGGGRIAVTLTNATEFGSVSFNARGGAAKFWSGFVNEHGAAGTIFLKGKLDNCGRLIIANHERAEVAPNPLNPTSFRSGTHVFDQIIITNNGVLACVDSGQIDLSGNTTVRTYNEGNIDDCRILVASNANLALPDDYTLDWTLSLSGTNTFTLCTSLTVASGGILTHEKNVESEVNKLNMLLGSLTIHAGGAIDVSARGFSATNGPGSPNGRYGGGHGGEGGLGYQTTVRAPTYGSITNPLRCGRGGSGFRGGGVVIMHVAGAVTNNGTIVAEGQKSVGYGAGGAGAGGSINITAGSLAGSGTIMAPGGMGVHSSGGGGGGRIAVALTTPGADFAAFPVSNIRARGGSVEALGNNDRAAAGTVYLKPAGAARGELVVDNSHATGARTLINSNVTDATVAGVSILDQAHLSVDTNQNLTVYGSWSNAATFSAASGGLVRFAGDNTSTNIIYGDTVFADLRCEVPGMTLKFEAGRSNAITDRIVFTGDDNEDLILRSTSPGTQWKMNVMDTVSSDKKAFNYLDVQDSDARPGTTITALDSVNSLNNSNWVFAVPGQINTWNGAVNTSWNEPGNWSLGYAPQLFDARIVIPNGCVNYPILAGPVTIAELVMESDATLQINSQVLTVNGAATIAGTLIASGTETVTFNSNLVFSAADGYTAAQSTLKLAGTGAQGFTPGGNVFYGLDIANTNPVTLTDGFTARDLTFPATTATVAFQGGFVVTNLSLVVTEGATLTFAAGATYTIGDHLWLRGASGKPVILTAAGTWRLEAGVHTSVRYVEVTDSDASGGRTIYAFDSTGHGSNPNWDFGISGKLWVGPDTDWTADANWSPSGAPGATSHVMIDGSAAAAPRLSSAATIGGLTAVGLAGPVTLTIDMPFAGPDALTVSGNVDIGTNATLTHTAANEVYRLALNVGSNLTIAVGGAIDVSKNGFAAGQGPGTPNGRYGGGHGGQGGRGYQTTVRAPAYGLAIAPVRCGRGGSNFSGGGVILLRVDGAVTNDGAIKADGNGGNSNYGAGAGGSINIRAYSLAGRGTISAMGGDAHTQGSGGGGAGGRIAVALTMPGADFTAFEATNIVAHGGYSPGNGPGNSEIPPTDSGSAGTVYLETAEQGAGKGIVTINNNAVATLARTQLPPALDPTLEELVNATVIVTNRGCVAITTNDIIAQLTVDSDTEKLHLGSAETVWTITGDMTFGATTYNKGGTYTYADWNDLPPTPASVEDSYGAILILRRARIVIRFR